MFDYTEGEGPIKSNIGIGADIVSISDISDLLESYPDQFREFAFSKREQQYCDRQQYPPQHYAARWAIKEAYVKSLERPEELPNLQSIEIRRDPKPHLYLAGDEYDILHQAAKSKGKGFEDVDIDISLSHDRSSDLAFGVIVIYI